MSQTTRVRSLGYPGAFEYFSSKLAPALPTTRLRQSHATIPACGIFLQFILPTPACHGRIFSPPKMDQLILPDWFRGFDQLYQEPDRAANSYRRDLPHWRYAGASYFVTFRLADSLPASALQEMREATALWESKRTAERNAPGGQVSETTREAHELFQKEQFIRMEQHLDLGHGSCVLRDTAARRMAEDAIGYFQGTRCRLAAWVVMPNHIHALCHPLEGWELEDLMASWKKHSAREINQLLGRSGPLWQPESYDRIIRDGDHFRRVVRYIVRNPVKACLSQDEAAVWVSPGILGEAGNQ